MGQQSHDVATRIYMLGRFEVRAGDRIIIDASWRRTKAKALVKLLVLQASRSLHREQVFDALWPHLRPEAAANNLRKNLHYLHAAFAHGGISSSVLSSEDNMVVLAPGVWLDIEAFERQAVTARDSWSDPNLYEQALSMYGGDLLPEDLYEEWTRPRREHLSALRIELLWELARLNAASGNTRPAEQRLLELLQADPLREEAHRSLMRLYAEAGSRSRALQQYQRCRDLLEHDLGVVPSEETDRLHREILEGSPLGTGPAATPYPSNLPGRMTRFIGREAERAELRRLLDQAARGHGALAIIGGEPGVGKTRLAEELAADACQRGFTALIGRCYEMAGAPPYTPFVEVLEAAARSFPPEALRSALGDSASEAAKLMPELRRLFTDIPPPPELPPEQERRYLFNGIREFWARASRAQTLILILEDLHWADEPTLLLLQHIAQHIHEIPLLVLATYRDVDPDVTYPLARALESLLRQRLAHDLTLKRLPEDDVSAMLQALSGQEPPDALLHAIQAHTEGNPFFVEEVFHHLAEEGRLFDAQGQWRSDLPVGELGVPRSVRLIIDRRLERLGEECRRVLAAAAVIGRAFTFDLLESLREVDADALLDAVDEAERARIITSTSDGIQDHLTFAHELIRQTLVSGLSLPARRRLHTRVAEAMERLYAGSLEEHAPQLAHHLYQAGVAADPQKTVHYLTLAGNRALGAAAFGDALRPYENALALLPADDRQKRADLLFKRGLALRGLGRWDEALADWREALAAYEEMGDAEAVGRMTREISNQLLWAARFLESLEVARRGLISLGQRMSADRCHLLAMASVPLSFAAGEYTVSARMIGEAMALAEQLGDQRLRAYVLNLKAWHHFAFDCHQHVAHP